MSPLQQNMALHSQEPVRSIVDQVRSFELNAVASGDVPWIKMRNGRQIVEMTIDSGAAATVVPRGAFDAEVIETLRTRTEVFATASGHRMPNYGGAANPCPVDEWNVSQYYGSGDGCQEAAYFGTGNGEQGKPRHLQGGWSHYQELQDWN